MEITVVKYKVQPEYVDQNKKNIALVMEYLKDNPIAPTFWYWVTQNEDKQAFEHYCIADSKATIEKLFEIPAFNNFRTQLAASNPIEEPKKHIKKMLNNNFIINK